MRLFDLLSMQTMAACHIYFNGNILNGGAAKTLQPIHQLGEQLGFVSVSHQMYEQLVVARETDFPWFDTQ